MLKWLNDLPRKFLPPCKEVMAMCSRGMDGKLTAGERFKVWSHCLYCLCCKRFAEQVGWMRKSMREMGDGNAGSAGGEGLGEEVKERMKMELARRSEE